MDRRNSSSDVPVGQQYAKNDLARRKSASGVDPAVFTISIDDEFAIEWLELRKRDETPGMSPNEMLKRLVLHAIRKGFMNKVPVCE